MNYASKQAHLLIFFLIYFQSDFQRIYNAMYIDVKLKLVCARLYNCFKEKESKN